MQSDTTIILAFDTSAAQCAAVLLRGDDVIAHQNKELGRTQVEQLFPMLEDMMQGANCSWQALDALAVCTGPGNFTGTRIGVSAARGLAMSLKIPAIGVSIFEAAALNAAKNENGLITVGVALPRSQFAMQKFGAGRPPTALSPPEISDTGEISAYSVADIAKAARLILASGANPPQAKPLYLRPADAAPAKDQPPVILNDR